MRTHTPSLLLSTVLALSGCTSPEQPADDEPFELVVDGKADASFDPFDAAGCSGPLMTDDDALPRLDWRGEDALGDVREYYRTRLCTTQTQCRAWRTERRRAGALRLSMGLDEHVRVIWSRYSSGRILLDVTTGTPLEVVGTLLVTDACMQWIEPVRRTREGDLFRDIQKATTAEF